MATDSGSQRRYLGRLVTHRNGEMTLFLPFVFVEDSDDMMRLVLVNPSDPSFLGIQGISNLEADLFMDDLESKTGTPPASRKSIEAMPEVEIEEEDHVAECAVCLDWMKVAKVMPCKHMFHGECVEKWLKIHGSCPVCRFQMPSDEERADEGGDDDNNGTRRIGREIWIPFSVTRISPTENFNRSSNQETEQQQTDEYRSSD